MTELQIMNELIDKAYYGYGFRPNIGGELYMMKREEYYSDHVMEHIEYGIDEDSIEKAIEHKDYCDNIKGDWYIEFSNSCEGADFVDDLELELSRTIQNFKSAFSNFLYDYLNLNDDHQLSYYDMKELAIKKYRKGRKI